MRSITLKYLHRKRSINQTEEKYELYIRHDCYSIVLTVSTLYLICSHIKNNSLSAQGKLNMKWRNTISSIKWKIQIVLYSIDVAMHDSREEKNILSAGTLSLSVHISLLAKCSKIWIMYFKNHKTIKNIFDGIFMTLIQEFSSAIEYLYYFSLCNGKRARIHLSIKPWIVLVFQTYLCYEELQLECWLVHGHLVVYVCQCNY